MDPGARWKKLEELSKWTFLSYIDQLAPEEITNFKEKLDG